jgi:hypothetical protein
LSAVAFPYTVYEKVYESNRVLNVQRTGGLLKGTVDRRLERLKCAVRHCWCDSGICGTALWRTAATAVVRKWRSAVPQGFVGRKEGLQKVH